MGDDVVTDGAAKRWERAHGIVAPAAVVHEIINAAQKANRRGLALQIEIIVRKFSAWQQASAQRHAPGLI